MFACGSGRGSVASWRVYWCLAVGLLAVLLSGCAADEGGGETPPAGPRGFGERCEQTEDCASGLCVRVDASGGICSAACGSDADCPRADNWACVGGEDLPVELCACRKLSESEVCGDGSDNDCNAQTDDCRICDGVPVPNDDPRHCGACGVVCSAEQACRAGACVCADEKLEQCGSRCVDTATDLANCGECGTECAPGQACVDGSCGCPDASSGDYCEGIGCVDLANATAHCGACGSECKAGQVCAEGSCVCPNEAAPDYCAGVGCIDLSADRNHCGRCEQACTFARGCVEGECVCPDETFNAFCEGVGCVDLKTSSNHCGECGAACAFDQACVDGACSCLSGQTLCDGECVDISTSREHCGGCGESCGPSQLCAAGECGCVNFGYSECGSECADLMNDAANCGACGEACGAGEVCSLGECVCDSGISCDGVCVAHDDASNCGACGRSCGDGQFCSGGACYCHGFGLSACGASCVDLTSDESNCLSCNTSCRAGEICSYGCGCPFGSTYCEASESCVSLASDEANCGSCGSVCDPGEVCSGGSCSCPEFGAQYCPSAGACVTTLDDEAHCGTCDNACEPGQTCQFGNCACPGGTELFCPAANACVDTWTDERNCGGCGITCPAGTQCASGQCVCDQAGLTLCGRSCFNLTTDRLHCGSCTNACTGNYACITGQCRCAAPVTGPAVRITTTTADDIRPAAAWNGTRVGVAYLAIASSGVGNVRFALLNPDGSVVSDDALTTYTEAEFGDGPDLVWSGTEFATVWLRRTSGLTELFFLRLDANGAPKGSPVLVASAPIWGMTEVSLAWNAAYGGYGVAYTTSNLVQRVALRRIGATAAAVEAENSVASPIGQAVSLAVAPDGTWMVASGGSGALDLTQYNIDGSRTLPSQRLTSSGVIFGSRWPAMIHDGRTWATAWLDASVGDLMLNRGAATNVPERILRTQISRTGEPVLALANGTLAIGWTERALTTGSYRFRMQRFAIPSANSSRVTSVHAPVDVLSTHNVAGLDNVELVSTGSNGMLGVWADDRWGVAREIYAAPINLGNCP